MKYCTMGGAPVPPSLVRDCTEKLKSQVTVGYGMTENSMASTMTWHGCSPDITSASIGKPLANVEVKIVNPGRVIKIYFFDTVKKFC